MSSEAETTASDAGAGTGTASADITTVEDFKRALKNDVIKVEEFVDKTGKQVDDFSVVVRFSSPGRVQATIEFKSRNVKIQEEMGTPTWLYFVAEVEAYGLKLSA